MQKAGILIWSLHNHDASHGRWVEGGGEGEYPDTRHENYLCYHQEVDVCET